MRRAAVTRDVTLLAIAVATGIGARPPIAAPRGAARTERPPFSSGKLLSRLGREDSLAASIDSFLARTVPFGFSGAVIIEVGDSIILDRGYGAADRSSRRPFTGDTPSEIGSLSKQFAAAAIMLLAQRNRLALTDSIGKYVPGVPPDKRAITIEELLTHTSGLRYDDVADYFLETPRDSALRSLLQLPLDTAPGAQWNYSNAGYRLLTAIVDTVAGIPFEAFVQDQLFRPTGMQCSGFFGTHARVSPGSQAHVYDGPIDHGPPSSWPGPAWYLRGNGGVVTCTHDLARWMHVLKHGQLLDSLHAAQLFAPHAAIGAVAPGLSYGFGWFVHDSGTANAQRYFEHGGDFIYGSNAAIYHFPSAKLTLILISNARAFHRSWMRYAVQDSVIKMLAGGPVQPAPSARTIAPALGRELAGPYALGAGSAADLKFDGTYLWLQVTGQSAVDALLSVPDSDRASAARFNGLTTSMLARLARNDTSALVEVLWGPMAPRIAEYIQEWRELTRQHGELRVATPLATVRNGSAFRTSIRLVFSRDTLIFRYNWASSEKPLVVGSGPEVGAYPIAQILAQVSTNAFVAYDLFTGRSMRVSRDRSLRGAPRLCFGAPAAALCAKRGTTDHT